VFIAVLVTLILAYAAYFFMKKSDRVPRFMTKHTHNRNIRWKLASLGVRLMSLSYFAMTFAALNELKNGLNGTWRAIAVVIVMVVTIGLPVMHVVVVVNRHHIRRKSIKYASDSSQSSVLDMEIKKLETMFKPLLSDFRREVDWFGLSIILRSLIASLLLVFLESRSFSQSLGMFLAYLAYGFGLSLRPYEKQVNFHMDVLMTCCDTVTLIIPLLYTALSDGMTKHSTEIGWTLLAIQGFVILVQMGHGVRLFHAQMIKLLGYMKSRSSTSMPIKRHQSSENVIDDGETDTNGGGTRRPSVVAEPPPGPPAQISQEERLQQQLQQLQQMQQQRRGSDAGRRGSDAMRRGSVAASRAAEAAQRGSAPLAHMEQKPSQTDKDIAIDIPDQSSNHNTAGGAAAIMIVDDNHAARAVGKDPNATSSAAKPIDNNPVPSSAVADQPPTSIDIIDAIADAGSDDDLTVQETDNFDMLMASHIPMSSRDDMHNSMILPESLKGIARVLDSGNTSRLTGNLGNLTSANLRINSEGSFYGPEDGTPRAPPEP